MPLHQRWNSICLAERVGFEPTVPLLVHELSKLARSATLTPLQFIGPYYFIIQFGHSPKESFGLTPLQFIGPYYFIIPLGHSPKESFGLTPLQFNLGLDFYC